MTGIGKTGNDTRTDTQDRRPTMGLLLDWIEDRYQIAILAGVADTAKDNDVNLVCFVGGRLRSPDALDAQRNVLYELAGPENVDGLLILSGATSCDVGLAETQTSCEEYRPLPIVSVALALESIHSVTVDNEKGLHDALVHLIDAHGHRPGHLQENRRAPQRSHLGRVGAGSRLDVLLHASLRGTREG